MKSGERAGQRDADARVGDEARVRRRSERCSLEARGGEPWMADAQRDALLRDAAPSVAMQLADGARSAALPAKKRIETSREK